MKTSFEDAVKQDAAEVSALPAKVLAAIEKWYAAHFHSATVKGISPISTEDKAALIAHVTGALHPEE